ncbi:MAG: hypothetical protein IPP22_15000 [Nitrosomonas sp.]|nr:hypothetical protein [Nitrosomonas sp.]
MELYCRSSNRAAGSRDRFLFQQRFETQMRALADGLNKREVPGDTTRYYNVLAGCRRNMREWPGTTPSK